MSSGIGPPGSHCFFCGISTARRMGGRRTRPQIRSSELCEGYLNRHPFVQDYANHLFSGPKQRKLRLVQKSVEPNSITSVLQQPISIDKKSAEQEPKNKGLLFEEPVTQYTFDTPPQSKIEKSYTKTDSIFKPQQTLQPIPYLNFKTEFKDNFDTKTDNVDTPEVLELVTESEPNQDKNKFTEEELGALRLELGNAEYLQLVSLLQVKINCEQFEIVKLRSQFSLKNKQETYANNGKYMKEHNLEEYEQKLRMIKENAELEQKIQRMISEIFHERVACIKLKIELAMKEILSNSQR